MSNLENANKFDEKLLKYWGLSGAKACKSCRSRQELSNEYLLAKFGFDTAENEPFQVLILFHFRVMGFNFHIGTPPAASAPAAEAPAADSAPGGAASVLDFLAAEAPPAAALPAEGHLSSKTK